MATNPLNNHAESRDELADEIKRLETSSGVAEIQRVSNAKLDEKQYTPSTDAEITKRAENELDEYRRNGIASVYAQNASDEKSMAATREGYGKSMDDALASLNKSYENAVRASDADAIKRGLARSSVAAVNRGEIEKEYLQKNAEISATYGKKIAELDAEISGLGSKLQTALNDFNLSYASRLDKRIAELKYERDKKVNEVTEYNNTVRAKQAELDREAAYAENKLYMQALEKEKATSSPDRLSAERREALYKSVYDAMDRYLGSMDEIEARIELRNHSLYRDHLSNYYYARLWDKYGRNELKDTEKKQ